MNTAAVGKLLAPLLSAAACSWLAVVALPKYPQQQPWPEWVGYAALSVAFLAYLGWFAGAAWAVSRVSALRVRWVRAALYLAVLLLSCQVPLVPLVPAYGLQLWCGLGVACEAKAQGLARILHNIAAQLDIVLAIPVSLVLVGLLVVTAPTRDARGGNT